MKSLNYDISVFPVFFSVSRSLSVVVKSLFELFIRIINLDFIFKGIKTVVHNERTVVFERIG